MMEKVPSKITILENEIEALSRERYAIEAKLDASHAHTEARNKDPNDTFDPTRHPLAWKSNIVPMTVEEAEMSRRVDELDDIIYDKTLELRKLQEN